MYFFKKNVRTSELFNRYNGGIHNEGKGTITYVFASRFTRTINETFRYGL